MYITCPSCSTSYDIDRRAVGVEGKQVRCFSCSHAWFQPPVAAQPPPARLAPMPQSAPPPPPPPQYAPQAYAPQPPYPPQAYAPQAPYPPQGYPPQGPYPPPPQYGAPPGQYAPEPPPPPPPEPEPEPAPEPEPEPEEEEEELELPSDEDLEEMLGPEEEMDGVESAADGGAEDLTEIDEEALESLPDPDPVGDLDSEAPGDDFADVDPEELLDPDPIPGVLVEASDDDPDAPMSRMGLWISIAGAVVVVLLLAGAIVMREAVVGFMPSANSFFTVIGLHVKEPGEGLRIRPKPISRETVGDKEVVVIAGEIENISDEPQDVPLIRILLYDANQQVVQSAEISPAKSHLKPGERFNFRTQIENLVATARRLDVTFGDLEKAKPKEDGAKKKK